MSRLRTGRDPAAARCDVADAVVAHTGAQLHADVITSDPAGIGRLLDAAGATSQIISL
jgi:hypothetical protein